MTDCNIEDHWTLYEVGYLVKAIIASIL